MAVPKKKTSRHRKGKRRSHHHLSAPGMSRCGRCGSPTKPHAVCDRCGHYGTLQVFAEVGDGSTPS
ncbi:MAG: 50S ribosomal protein L32 [Planctomycetes bacterium]|nr:50S ribosomal protein L32 [Planctomycetota bacterium]